MSDRDDTIQQRQQAHAVAGGAPAAGAGADEVSGPHGDPLSEALSGDGPAGAGGDATDAGPPSRDAGGDPSDVATAPEVEADLEQLRALAGQRDEYLALAQRAQADFENYRKRMARETAQAMERGAGRLAKELLPALDHLELALRAAEAEGGELFKGVRMVQDEMIGALGRAGIEPFSPTGEPFDPNEHEAMVSRPQEGAEPGTVLEVYQQGYRLNGAVLRPARVVVAA